MSGSMTGGVDASIPLRVGQGIVQPQNPLDTFGKFATIQNQLNQNKLFPGQLQLQQQEIQSNATTLVQQHRHAAASAMLPLLNKPGLLSQSDASTALGGFTAAGGESSGALSEISHIPSGDPVEFDRGLRAWVAANSQTDAGNAYRNVTPDQLLENVGPGLQSFNRTRGGLQGQGTISPVGGIAQVSPSTSDLMQPVEWTDNKGVKQHTTKAQYNIALNNGSAVGPALPMFGGGSSAPATAPGAPASPNTPPAGYTGRLPQSNGGGLSLSGPAPGTQGPAEVSGTQYAADRAAVSSLNDRLNPLNSMRSLLANDNVQTGAGSETLNHARNLLISMQSQGLLPKSLTPDKLQNASFEEFRKYAAQAIAGQPFAGGSDARMAETIAGSPNASLSTLTNKQLVDVLIGMEKWRAGRILGFQQAVRGGAYGQAAAQDPRLAAGHYADYAADYGSRVDPRAFAHGLIPAAQESKMYNAMTDTQKKAYRDSLRVAAGMPGMVQ